MKALFVTHKWGDAVPGTGESVMIPHLVVLRQSCRGRTRAA